jgi:hypothetical protein
MPVCSADSYCFEGICICHPPLKLFQKQCINLKNNNEKQIKKEDKKEVKIKSHQRCLHFEEFGGNFDSKLALNDNFIKKNILKRKLKKGKRRKRKLKDIEEKQKKVKEKGKSIPVSFKIFFDFKLI